MVARIGIGLDDIYFGQYKSEFEFLYGQPDKKTEMTFSSDKSVFYTYNSLMSILEFSSEDNYKLVSIHVFDPNLQINQKLIITMAKNEAEKLFSEMGTTTSEYETYDLYDTIYYEQFNITLFLEFDSVVSVEFGPVFDENGEYIWPSEKR